MGPSVELRRMDGPGHCQVDEKNNGVLAGRREGACEGQDSHRRQRVRGSS